MHRLCLPRHPKPISCIELFIDMQPSHSYPCLARTRGLIKKNGVRNMTIFTRKGIEVVCAKILDSRFTAYFLASIIIGVHYTPLLKFYFFADDFNFLYRAKYHFSFYNVFIYQFFHGFFYRPIAEGCLYGFFYSLFGINPIGFRAVIICVLLLNVLLVYELSLLITKRRYIACAACIFYVTRVALALAVLWIAAGFEELACTFFILLTILFYLLHLGNNSRFLYLAGIMTALLAQLSKESAIVIPLVIVMIECLMHHGNVNVQNLKKAFLKVIPFCIIAAIPLMRLALDTDFAKHRENVYVTSLSFHVLLKNSFYFITQSFNNTPELLLAAVFLAAAFLCLFNKAYQIKHVCFACGLLAAAILPFLTLTGELSSYYLSFFLAGLSLLLSIGIKNISKLFPKIKFYLVLTFMFLNIFSLNTSISRSHNFKGYYDVGMIASNAIRDLKQDHADLPDGSLIFIKNSDRNLFWALGRGTLVKIIYNNTVVVYFQGISKKKILPAVCSHIYVYTYENKRLSFVGYQKGAALEELVN